MDPFWSLNEQMDLDSNVHIFRFKLRYQLLSVMKWLWLCYLFLIAKTWLSRHWCVLKWHYSDFLGNSAGNWSCQRQLFHNTNTSKYIRKYIKCIYWVWVNTAVTPQGNIVFITKKSGDQVAFTSDSSLLVKRRRSRGRLPVSLEWGRGWRWGQRAGGLGASVSATVLGHRCYRQLLSKQDTWEPTWKIQRQTHSPLETRKTSMKTTGLQTLSHNHRTIHHTTKQQCWDSAKVFSESMHSYRQIHTLHLSFFHISASRTCLEATACVSADDL